jgi:hypothetical protein
MILDSEGVLRPTPRPVSDEEQRAVELMVQISTDGVEARAARLKADASLSTLTSEPTPVPTFVMRKNTAERSRIQAEIDALL